jgi:hypothetical protein
MHAGGCSSLCVNPQSDFRHLVYPASDETSTLSVRVVTDRCGPDYYSQLAEW